MFRKITDFQTIWAEESESTLKIFRTLTDNSLSQKVTADGRSLGFLAWHITQTLGDMTKLVGLNVDAPTYETAMPETINEIVTAYKKGAKSVGEQIAQNWRDEILEQTDDLYGETWTRGFTLFVLIAHQTHHRGQMTVLMRQVGLKVPGVYGPAKEEWAAIGMAAMQ